MIGTHRRSPILGARHTTDNVDALVKAESVHRQRVLQEWDVDQHPAFRNKTLSVISPDGGFC